MRVAWFPKAADLAGNPYWPLLQQELEALGVEFETSHSGFWLSGSWLWENRQRIQVLHFHFIQPHYAVSEARVSMRRLLKFATYLVLARLLGYRLIWTMHDLMPTWPKSPYWIDKLARFVIAGLSNDVIVHCQEARSLLRHTFGRSNGVWVLSHPSYIDIYPLQISSTAEARDRLRLPFGKFIVGFVGGIRPNKGLEDLISAFHRSGIENAMLLIAGRPWKPESYVDSVRKLADKSSQIEVVAREIPDEEIQFYMCACDVLVFPFRQVLTSGSAILAMAFGKPVIVPEMGCLPELVGTDAGFTYPPGDVTALAAAIERAAAADLTAMGHAAAQRVNAYTWRDLALATLRIYSGDFTR